MAINHKHKNEQLEKNKQRKDAIRQEKRWLQDNFLLARGVHKPSERILETRELWIAENPGMEPPWIKYSRG